MRHVFSVWMAAGLIACAAGAALAQTPPNYIGPPAHGTYQIHIVDVGTGLGTIIEGDDFLAIYDGGSNDDIARGSKNRLLAYLRLIRPDLQTIDHLILSHPHRDHVELLPDVFDKYQVRDAWDSGRPFYKCGYRSFLTKIAGTPGIKYHDAVAENGTHQLKFKAQKCYGADLKAKTVKVSGSKAIAAGTRVPLGEGAAMTFLYANGVPNANPNENSLVVLFELGTARVLFVGDSQAGERGNPADAPRANSTEGKLLQCCRDQLHADLLVVGHHGSRTSSRDQFLDAVDAKAFVVSSGPTKYNSVTLPDKVVINDLTKRGTLFRTDILDAQCKKNKHKVGADNDGRPGGCTNIVFEVSSGHAVSGTTWSPEDTQ
jgi:competence protein ComEC